MNTNLIPISLILFSALYAGVGLLVWSRRPGLAITPFAWMMFSIAVWSLGYGLELFAQTLSGKITWFNVEIFGGVSVVVFLVIFIAAYTGHNNLLTMRNQILLWVIPIMTILLTWTNRYHFLIWKTVKIGTLGGISFLDPVYGNWFWLQVAYSYTLVIIGLTFLVLEIIRSPRPYNFQAGIILLGSIFPWVGSFLYLSEIILPGIDVTPFFFLPMVLLMTWGIFRYSLLGILPAAPSIILHELQDGVIVIDNRKRILYLNTMAEQILQTSAERSIGQPLETVQPSCAETLQSLMEKKEAFTERKFKLNGQERFFDIRLFHLSAKEWGTNSSNASHLIIFRDIHQRKQMELHLQHREEIMSALSMASQKFLQTPAWEGNIPAFLERLGQATGVSRAYVFQNYENLNEQIITSQCYEWTAPHIEPQINNPVFLHLPVRNIGPASWSVELSQGHLVNAQIYKIPEAERTEFINHGARSIVLAPIFVEKRWWGILGLEDYISERNWSITELEALQAAVDIFSASEWRARNENTLRRRQWTLNLLHEIVASALQSPDRQAMAYTVVDNLNQLISADGCFLSLWNEDKQEFTPLAAHGQYAEEYYSLIVKPGEITITNSVLEVGHTLPIEDVANSPYLSKRISKKLPFHSVLAFPLVADKKKLGAILLGYIDPHQFLPEDISVGEQAASLIALALEKFQAVEDAKRQAEESEMLRKAGASIASTLNSREAIDRILEQLSIVIPYDSASVQLLRENEMEIVGGRGWDNPEDVLGLRFPFPDDNPNTIIMETGKPYILTNAVEAHSSFREEGPHSHIRSWLGVPLIVRGQIIGLLAIDSAKPNHFTTVHVKTATTFADQVAIALENARLFEETQKRLREQTMLRNAVATISSALDTRTILARLAEQLGKAIDATSAYISDYNGKAKSFTVIAEFISDNASQEEKVSDLRETYLRAWDEVDFIEQMKSGQYVVYHVDDSDAPEIEHQHMRHYGAQSILYIPLIVKKQLIGFAELWESRYKREFSSDEINLCQILSQQTAIAIENARLFEKIQSLALTDPLTGLYNRRGLFEVGLIEFARARRLKRPFAAIMIDIDHFKQINDLHGHPIGDQVLKSLASRLRSTTREIDIIGRYGGEEFAFFLPESKLEAALEMAERMRVEIQETPFQTGVGEVALTISLGVASFDEHTPDLETLVARADQALYVAKHRGRNRIAVGK